MDVLSDQYARSHSEVTDANSGSVLRVQGLKDELIANVREMLWVLFGAVSLVLLIACANIASLFLARAAARSREFAVRAALGATRPRLVSQLLAESILLSAIGGIAGVLLAKWALSVAIRSSALNLPRTSEIRLDGVVLAFTGVVSIMTGVLFGLFPSIRASRPDIADALRDRGEGAGQVSRPGSFLGVSTRNLLVVGQIALSIVLLIGAALLLKSFARLRSVDPGFQPSDLLTMQIALPPLRYDTNVKRAAFWKELVQRLEAIHGVRSASAMLTLPMSPAYGMAFQPAEQIPMKPNERPIGQFQSVTLGTSRPFGSRFGQGGHSPITIMCPLRHVSS
ncbi:MAG: FtsX-like permease family protein [Bryobacteraceae bacterium]